MAAGLIEMFYLINYYSNWSDYDNVIKVLAVSDFCFLLDTLMFSVLAYSLLKMSGAQLCSCGKKEKHSSKVADQQ